MRKGTAIGMAAVMVLMGFVMIDGETKAESPGPGITVDGILNVPGEYGTIQAAINAASPGETISVAAGTYTENLAIGKSLILKGAGEDLTFIRSSGTWPLITVSADDVTIQDLELMDATQLVEGIRVVSGASSGLTLDHVDFTNLGNSGTNAYGINVKNSFTGLSVNHCDFIAMLHTSYSRAIGIFASNHFNLNDFEISDSTFERLFVGIYLRSAIDGLDASGNTFGPFQLCDCRACVAGIYIGDGDNYNFDIENIVVTDNTFTDYGRGVYVWNYANDAIIGDFEIYENSFTDSIWSSTVRFIGGLGYNENVGFQGPISIHDNEITQDSGVGANVAMIDFRTYCKLASCDIAVNDNEITFSGSTFDAAMYGILFYAVEGPFTDSVVEGNTLDGGGVGGAGLSSAGVLVRHHASDYWPSQTMELEVFHNDISGYDHGVSIYDAKASAYGGLPTGCDVKVKYNLIDGNTLYGVINGAGETLDASVNCWGTDKADEVALEVSSNVDYTPWLKTSRNHHGPGHHGPGGKERETGFQPDLKELFVDDDSPQTGSEGRVQEGVDEVADRGKVRVEPGDYYGAVVTKAVEIRGNRKATRIVDGPEYKPGSALHIGFKIGYGLGGDGCKIKDLTFECSAPSLSTPGLVFAIFAKNADDVTVEHCIFNNALQGITNWGGNGWKIRHNDFNDLHTLSGGGIAILCGDYQGTTSNDNTIEHNKIVGTLQVASGDCGGYDGTGIVLYADFRWGGAGASAVTDNVIKHNKVKMVSDTPGTVDFNAIELTDSRDLANPVGGQVITGNTIEKNDMKGSANGLVLTPSNLGDYNTIRKNRF